MEWGGKDGRRCKCICADDEMQQAGVPSPLGFNTSMVGPVIAQFGTQAQKKYYLHARRHNLDDWWCIRIPEPGAGSDLASLRTKAERVGDTWVINGQKTWTTMAQHADWIFVLCRTDPAAKKQGGYFVHSLRHENQGRHGAAESRLSTAATGRLESVFLTMWWCRRRIWLEGEDRGWDCAEVPAWRP